MKASFESYSPNDGLYIAKIKFSNIEKLDFVKLNDPSETLQSYYDRVKEKPDILLNAGLFTLSTGKNILSFKDEGVEQNYTGDFEGFGIKEDIPNKVFFCSSKEPATRDFMSAFPVLIRDGKRTTSDEWGNATEINYPAARQAIGYDDEYLYILTTDNKCYFSSLQDVFENLGVKYAINLDGGGSVKRMEYGETVNQPSENRAIDNAFQVFMKDVSIEYDESFVPGVYEVTVDTSLNVRSEPSTASGEIYCTLFNEDQITILKVTSDGKWGEIPYGDSVAYISMDYVERLSDLEEDEDPEEDEPSTEEPETPIEDDPTEEDPSESENEEQKATLIDECIKLLTFHNLIDSSNEDEVNEWRHVLTVNTISDLPIRYWITLVQLFKKL